MTFKVLKNRQRITLVAVAAAAMLLGTAACGQGSAADDATDSATTQNTSDAGAPEEPQDEGQSEPEPSDQEVVPSCGVITVADLDDVQVRAAYYAMDEGLVTSDLIERVEVDYLALPTLIQMTGNEDYDITSTSLAGALYASTRGEIDLRVVAFKQIYGPDSSVIFTNKESSLNEPSDLVGSSFGVTSLASTTTDTTRILLGEKYGIDAKNEGGEVDFVELDGNTMLGALEKGQIDAGELFGYPLWLAQESADLRVLMQKATEYAEFTGASYTGAVLLARQETIDENPACIDEYQRMLQESVDYYEKTDTEGVAQAVADASDVAVDPEYLVWSTKVTPYGGNLDPDSLASAQYYYEKAFEYELLPALYDIEAAIYQSSN